MWLTRSTYRNGRNVLNKKKKVQNRTFFFLLEKLKILRKFVDSKIKIFYCLEVLIKDIIKKNRRGETKEEMGREKGITLIALVITIIVLIILAGVSINLILGENGIITKAQQAKKVQTEEDIKEKISMMIAEYAIERESNNKILLEFLQEKKDKQELDEVIDNSDGTITVELNGYSVTIDVEKLNIISIDKNGKIARIKLNTTAAKLSETITAVVTFGEGIDSSKCKWVYSTDLQIGTDEANYANTFSSSENTIDLTATEEGIYYLHILVVDKEGNKTEKVSSSVKVGNYVTLITLDKTELSIEEGQEETITATVEPNDATNKEIEWISSDSTIATIDKTGKIIAVKAGNITITATAKDGSEIKAVCNVEVKAKEPVDVSTIEKGIFIEYDVEYTDIYAGNTNAVYYTYTKTNGWRLLNYDTREDGKTLYNVQLISTGIPAAYKGGYNNHDKNNRSKWVTNTTKLNEFKKLLGTDYNFSVAAMSQYYGLQEAAGLYYNLGDMIFKKYEPVLLGEHMGGYRKVKNGKTTYTSGDATGNNLFKAREDASIRILTLPELNKAVGRTDIDSMNSFTDTTGLFQLSKLSNKLNEKIYSSARYYLASPEPGLASGVCQVESDNLFVSKLSHYGIRPVISLSSDIQLTKETNLDGLIYYKIKN